MQSERLAFSCLSSAGWQKKSCPGCGKALAESLVAKSIAAAMNPGDDVCPGCRFDFK